MEQIPLSVHRWRGHHENEDWYHPRNLLDGKGTQTEYVSANDKPEVGDWIVFQIESECKVIPRGVMIRNVRGKYGLRSIELSLAVDGDGDEFDEFAVIEDIRKGDM